MKTDESQTSHIGVLEHTQSSLAKRVHVKDLSGCKLFENQFRASASFVWVW